VRLLYVDGDYNKNKIKTQQKVPKNRPKRDPKKWPRGPPGRGVLRFWPQAYRNPVHILAIFRIFTKN